MSAAAARWGLPEDFEPVRYAVNDDIKALVRDLLGPDEPVLVTVANESDSISLIATTQRIFTIRSGGATAGVTGFTTREFPWEALTDMRLQSGALNVGISLHFQSKDGGRTAEVGVRAKFGKPAVDKIMPFESAAGTTAFEAIHSLWHYRRSVQQG
jgi:hypothetical protein